MCSAGQDIIDGLKSALEHAKCGCPNARLEEVRADGQLTLYCPDCKCRTFVLPPKPAKEI